MQPWSFRSSPGASDPAAELEILVWKFKYRPGPSDPAPEPQIQPQNLKSCSGTSNVDLHPQIQSWSLRFSTSAPEPAPELTFLGKMQGLPTENQHFRPKCMVS